MFNFVEFILALLLIIVIAAFLVLATGLIHNRNGYVSIIEKKHQFHHIEIRKLSWYMPLLYRKAAYYPTIEVQKKVNKKTITYIITDVMTLYKSKQNIKDVIRNSKNLKKDLASIGVKLIKEK